MSQCRQCGATLPDNAKVCFQCGTDATAPAPQGQQKELDFLKPALVGGLVLGLLSSLPYIGILCCIWVLGGGAIATYLLNQQRPGRLTYSDGAFAGIISGVLGAIVATLVSIPVRIMSAESLEQARAQMEQGMQQAANGPQWVRDFMNFMMQLMSPEITATQLLFTFIINAFFFGLFAMVGGIITAAILKKKGAE